MSLPELQQIQPADYILFGRPVCSSSKQEMYSGIPNHKIPGSGKPEISLLTINNYESGFQVVQPIIHIDDIRVIAFIEEIEEQVLRCGQFEIFSRRKSAWLRACLELCKRDANNNFVLDEDTTICKINAVIMPASVILSLGQSIHLITNFDSDNLFVSPARTNIEDFLSQSEPAVIKYNKDSLGAIMDQAIVVSTFEIWRGQKVGTA